MEYITEEQFLEQNKKIQKVFLDQWKPSIGDLVCIKDMFGISHISCILSDEEVDMVKCNIENDKVVPLLSEGQLRKFIEDKIGYINITYSSNYEDMINKTVNDNKSYLINSDDLFRAYWKVALELAKQEVNIND